MPAARGHNSPDKTTNRYVGRGEPWSDSLPSTSRTCFARPKAFNLDTWGEGKPILDAYAEFNSLIALADYTKAVKDRLIELLLRVEVYRTDAAGVIHRNRVTDPEWAWLRANRGTFDIDHEATGIEIVANNRSDWIGWLELAKETINELTVEITARVIDDVAADVICVVRPRTDPRSIGSTTSDCSTHTNT